MASPIPALIHLLLVSGLCSLAPVQDVPPRSPGGPELLAAHVQGLVETGEVVGAELFVIQGERTLLHHAFGWKDREAEVPMQVGTRFNVRSMTKPVVGTLAQIDVDEGRLALADPVALHLPEFAAPAVAGITLEHLLGHRSGLEWSACMGGASLGEMARCAADLGPTQFLPGTSFSYSNTGSNVLGALLEAVGEASLDERVTRRLLEPLGMGESVSAGLADEAYLARCASRYVRGEDGGWEASWKPADGRPMPFLQGAQGLLTSAEDYARFLRLWLDGGEQLVSPEAVARGLHPASLTELPTTFPGRSVYYGQHWKLWTRGPAGALEAFGHSGSDGTFAWVFPERELIVLYFTQCELTTTGIELEAVIAEHLLADETSARDAALAPYLGTYWNEEKSMVRVVDLDPDGRLRLDVVGTGVFELVATDDPLRFEIPGRTGFDVHFERDGSGGIARLVPPPSTNEGVSTRLEPGAGLPGVDELMQRRLGLHGERALSTLGLFRLEGHFIDQGEKTWRDELLSDGRLRSSEAVHRSKRGPSVTVCNGTRAQTVSPSGRRKLLSGAQRSAALSGRLSVIAGDWREHFERVEVLARTRREDASVLIVRAQAADAPATYYVVEEESLRVREVVTSLATPFGSMGKVTELGDWREVEGVALPFSWKGRFASESLGSWELQYEALETHLELDEGAFAIEP